MNADPDPRDWVSAGIQVAWGWAGCTARGNGGQPCSSTPGQNYCNSIFWRPNNLEFDISLIVDHESWTDLSVHSTDVAIKWIYCCGRWVTKLVRWVAKLGRWVAKLEARLLATAALWVQIQSSIKSINWTTWAKEWPTHASPPKQHKKIFLRSFANIMIYDVMLIFRSER